jgi:hypothetical protein
MKCKFRITLKDGRRADILTMPQADYWQGHAALLVALGIPDAHPVASEKEAEAIARHVQSASQVIAQAGAGSGTNGARKRKR